MTDLNDIMHWFPILEETGVPVPKTILINSHIATRDFFSLLDGEVPKGDWNGFIEYVTHCCDIVGYPAFLRTGHGSGKHGWDRTCLVNKSEVVAERVGNLVDWSCMVGLPLVNWAVREILPIEPAFHAFSGTPITRERRMFIEDGGVVCNHPYWPHDSIRRPDKDNWAELLTGLNGITDEHSDLLHDQSANVSRYFPGAWSLDWLNATNGWYAIDMATAHSSYHWASCPSANRWGSP